MSQKVLSGASSMRSKRSDRHALHHCLFACPLIDNDSTSSTSTLLQTDDLGTREKSDFL